MNAAVAPPPTDEPVILDGEPYVRIRAYDRMPPFLVTLPGETDTWAFVSSAGGLTAGRVDADGALFPYETVDRLHDAHAHTGPVTLLRVLGEGGASTLWEPFSPCAAPGGVGGASGVDGTRERNLYKNLTGNRLVFEEIHRGLGLAFRYRWTSCEVFGHVRTATLVNLGAGPLAVELVDGLRNLLPYGAPLALYQQASSLVDAYRQSEVDPRSGLAVFALTSRIVDRPEACEVLRASVAWCHGLPDPRVTLALEALDAFRRGEPTVPEILRTGRRGHFLVEARLALGPGESVRWHVVADAARTQAQVAALRARLIGDAGLGHAVDEALDGARETLRRLVASADGIELTARPVAAAHRFANVLFNAMRGGVFAHGHAIPAADFADFLRVRQPRVAVRHAALLSGLPAELDVRALLRCAAATADPDLERLAHEYLPLWFGRRHGDPSRPWNRFRIQAAGPDGARALQYEGNWRDIFQNWEALALSFPAFLPGLVAKFVNASTVDGFNPYRIAREGIEWEVEEPGSPWSHIGYWGDHQTIYLLKLLEWLERFSPGELGALLGRRIFSYADVPYRIAPYASLVQDPRATITFDHALAARIAERTTRLGTDGRLVLGADGAVVHVTLLEKLLVSLLARMSNLVPEGGVWMNTQRPEWNDANNALVGRGVSVVTLAYLRRFLAFVVPLLDERGGERVPVSGEVVRWARRVSAVLEETRPTLRGAFDDHARRRFLDGVGQAFGAYRETVYAHGLSEPEDLPMAEAAGLCRAALAHVEHALSANRRADGLYHAYNLLAFAPDGGRLSLERLDVMLEGQVAALSSGLVGAEEAVRLLDALFAGPLYVADRRSFLLYPDRRLPAFLARNVIPATRARALPLVGRLLGAGERTVVLEDGDGVCRFAPELVNAEALAQALERLAQDPAWGEDVARGRGEMLALYEEVFAHGAFTGRSGTMYAYEGLGSVYWHMVAKLLLAVQEVLVCARGRGAPDATCAALAQAYARIRSGLGAEKSAAEWGAFPADPYSHTPAHAGAQQPGMTGQVKEEILARLGELGATIEHGRLVFDPRLVDEEEFLRAPGMYASWDTAGRPLELPVPAGAFAFAICRVPILVRRGRGAAGVLVTWADGRTTRTPGHALDRDTSRAVFAGGGAVARLDIEVPADALRPR